MIWRIIFWANRCWHDWRDAMTPHVQPQREWHYSRDGDSL